LESFPAEELRKLDVTHITGERDFETVKAIYSSRRVEARVLPFYERMEELFPEADFAITRAGASTLFELALYGLPAIVFPYPYTPDGHQEQNAHYFEKEGAVVLLREASCPPERLRSEVLELIRSSEKRGRMAENLKRLARPDASEKLAELAESLVGQREGCLV
jgi:UDP-N-acetylglucosamine--N-acetylmuramyl-(pentapeptide) pyrophosphoryl-undecaprenol N-acetylglucosamine transferase